MQVKIKKIIASNMPRTISADVFARVPLYMDQILQMINSSKMGLENRRKLTKTMVNNYTKEGLILKNHKKLYSKEHIMMIVVVLTLKQVMPMVELKKLINTLNKKIKKDEYTYNPTFVHEVYNQIISAEEKSSELIVNFLTQMEEKMDPENDYDIPLKLVQMGSFAYNCCAVMDKLLVYYTTRRAAPQIKLEERTK